MNDRKHTIFIDWGTTNVRAFLLDAAKVVVEKRTSDQGIKFVREGEFPAVFEELTRGWRQISRFTLMAGMIGSVNGWEEAPYIRLPASPEQVGRHIYKMQSIDDVYIIGGLSCCRRQEPPLEDSYDVMRGEEVQIIGLMSRLAKGPHLVCLPGTHSKWLEIDENGVISSFTTVMSGDFFAAVRSKTIIAMSLENKQKYSANAFARGVRLARTPGGVMVHIFKIRSGLLFKTLPPEHVESILSGIIIGNEIQEMRSIYDAGAVVHVIASARLGEKYAKALELAGCGCRLYDGSDMSLAGMRQLVTQLEN